MAKNIKWALMAAAGIAFLAMPVYGLFLQNQKRRLQAELEVQKKETAGLRHELKLNYQVLTAREQDKKRLKEEKEALAGELERYYEADCQARVWADALCPAGVIERLR